MRERLLKGDYSLCSMDDCHYLMMGTINEFQTELEGISEYPEMLALSFENNCNYKCTSCTKHRINEGKTKEEKEELERNYDVIESGIRQVLPYVKRINTNGSLFDEEHWKQIENLGKYNLHGL